ncbi:hypothetical protein H1C71_038471 [Ictidomys tridecemlineatus]|nr:hypothetical protein H1C71_038471 [Ictidomys tridecemlineatus]KAG3255518.1 hypothetical protein H1C71_038471 [Ictidomys tridecemlineatus]
MVSQCFHKAWQAAASPQPLPAYWRGTHEFRCGFHDGSLSYSCTILTAKEVASGDGGGSRRLNETDHEKTSDFWDDWPNSGGRSESDNLKLWIKAKTRNE